MNHHFWIFRLLMISVFSLVIQIFDSGQIMAALSWKYIPDFSAYYVQADKDNELTGALGKLNAEFQENISSGNFSSAKMNFDNLRSMIEKPGIDTLVLSDSYYFSGVFCLLRGANSDAVKWLKGSLNLREIVQVYDMIYAKCVYNLGVAYNETGDYSKLKMYTLKSLEIEKKLLGDSDPALLTSYATLISAFLGLKEYDEAVVYGNIALEIARDQHESNPDFADIFANMGHCYAKLSDYTKAALYLEKSATFYDKGILKKDERYINILNSLAVVYGYLGYSDKSEDYFRRGIDIARDTNSILSFNFVNSRAIFLAHSGKRDQGEKLLSEALNEARNIFGTGSAGYITVLRYFAEYLRGISGDKERALALYQECVDYIKDNEHNIALREPVMLGYALALSANGKDDKALEVTGDLLFPGASGKSHKSRLITNPEPGQITPDLFSLNVLKAKYRALEGLYAQTGNPEYLLAGAQTSSTIISVLEKIRINISEEESRLIIGDRYRDHYINAIHAYDRCYKVTGDEEYLAGAFQYFEKSKVAGLLASTRELKASQLQVPQDIALLERRLQNEISFYNSRIESEKEQDNPDYDLVGEWNESLFSATRKRDSLVNIFEREYPGYYRIKYNTAVVSPDEIKSIAGKRINYLNYVLADSFLSVFIVNNKYKKLLSIPVDSSFYSSIGEFRKLLASPMLNSNIRTDFDNFKRIGNKLYALLFQPVRQYLISDKLLISSDNILTYIPFEAIPGPVSSPDENLHYGNLPYLMNDFRISYTYSATFMAEFPEPDFSLLNTAIAFAPEYNYRLNIDSLLSARHSGNTQLPDLPFAREEAEFITGLTGGTLYEGAAATESVFKSEAGNYDIIHLAMHTLLNDRSPMHSKMLFHPEPEIDEDGFLNTFEVYGTPLKAKMVVLSSCNTGTGLLHEGEGILSLARGFVYSGSKSVVLSMWEIEDRSGADIIISYYKYLKKGYSKSTALKKARKKYLGKADRLRSHPYFWSAYVIYGSNGPVYYGRHLTMILITIAAFLGVCLYLRLK